jgi:hypothetical protein
MTDAGRERKRKGQHGRYKGNRSDPGHLVAATFACIGVVVPA